MSDDAPSLDRRIRIGRIAVLVGAALVPVIALFIGVVFRTEPASDAVETLGLTAFGICVVAFIAAGLGGPIIWGLGLRAMGRPWWPAALMLAAFIAAGTVLFIWWLDEAFSGLGAGFF